MNYQDKVKQFQLISGQPVSDTRIALTKEEYDFRDSLIREEIRELQYAIVDNNRVEILDALCDIKYVNDGTANQIGIFQDENWEINNYGTGYKSNEILDLLIEKSADEVMEINSLVYYLSASFNFTLENFKTALDRVHESNMSKFCLDTKTVDATQQFYLKQGIYTYVEPKEKVTVVYRKGDGKVLKSINYHPVQLEDLV